MPEHRVIRFADVRGHDRARDFLLAAVREQRLAHALLFAGPDGIGKRAVALALAAHLLCAGELDERGDACGVCASCRQIAAKTHADLQLVGLASGKKEIGVDRARELKRFMQLQPLSGRCKIAIVDDAHLLGVAAQNALLKTLEEPPQRSFLILIVNNPDGLLSTVRSRCQRVTFFPLRDDAVAEILIQDHGLDVAAAAELAALAEGSPGRALQLRGCVLDGARARLEASLAQVGGARYSRTMQFAQELGQPESEVAVKLELMLSYFRNQVMEKLDMGSQGDVSRLLRQADLVNEAWQAVRHRNPNRQLLLESLLLRLGTV